MTQAVLKTYELTKKYGEVYALNAVSLILKQGDIYGLIGRNGAGEITFFKCVMGLTNPTSGMVEIKNEKNNLNLARRKIGFMINPCFFPYINPNSEQITMLFRN